MELLRFPWPGLYPQTSAPAGHAAFTTFVLKREGSHLIKKAGGKTLAGQWERSRIERPAPAPHSPPHPPTATSLLYDSTNLRLKFTGTFHEQSA